MYLLDTNIWLERLLGRAKSDDVGRFLSAVSSDQLFISDFAFHSICVILTRLKQTNVLLDFVEDVFINGDVAIVSIKAAETRELTDAIDQYGLDFDDAYQYLVAEHNSFVMVSFDSDLDKTPIGRKTPEDILNTLNPPATP